MTGVNTSIALVAAGLMGKICLVFYIKAKFTLGMSALFYMQFSTQHCLLELILVFGVVPCAEKCTPKTIVWDTLGLISKSSLEYYSKFHQFLQYFIM